jgi:hypothetical protein
MNLAVVRPDLLAPNLEFLRGARFYGGSIHPKILSQAKSELKNPKRKGMFVALRKLRALEKITLNESQTAASGLRG